SISVKRDLANATYWNINSPNYDNGVIEVISATPNNPGCVTHAPQNGGNPIPVPLFAQACNLDPHTGVGCDPTTAFTPTNNISGYITHDQAISGTTALTEVAFIDEGTADQVEQNYLISTCGTILSNGTNVGACHCPSEVSF